MMVMSMIRKSILALAFNFVMVLMVGCSPGERNSPDSIMQQPAKAILHRIEINHMKFEPAELVVNKGDRIVFVNADIMTHDVTEEKNRSWTSMALKPGEYWALTITRTSNYFCSIHPVMKGKIIVK